MTPPLEQWLFWVCGLNLSSVVLPAPEAWAGGRRNCISMNWNPQSILPFQDQWVSESELPHLALLLLSVDVKELWWHLRWERSIKQRAKCCSVWAGGKRRRRHLCANFCVFCTLLRCHPASRKMKDACWCESKILLVALAEFTLLGYSWVLMLI